MSHLHQLLFINWESKRHQITSLNTRAYYITYLARFYLYMFITTAQKFQKLACNCQFSYKVQFMNYYVVIVFEILLFHEISMT